MIEEMTRQPVANNSGNEKTGNITKTLRVKMKSPRKQTVTCKAKSDAKHRSPKTRAPVATKADISLLFAPILFKIPRLISSFFAK